MSFPNSPGQPPAWPPKIICNASRWALVGTLVDEHPERHARLAGPDVPLEGAERDNVQPVEYDVAVPPLVDMPGEDALAVALTGRLGERARARDRAFADVEPVAGQRPLRDLGHRPSFSSAHPSAPGARELLLGYATVGTMALRASAC